MLGYLNVTPGEEQLVQGELLFPTKFFFVDSRQLCRVYLFILLHTATSRRLKKENKKSIKFGATREMALNGASTRHFIREYNSNQWKNNSHKTGVTSYFLHFWFLSWWNNPVTRSNWIFLLQVFRFSSDVAKSSRPVVIDSIEVGWYCNFWSCCASLSLKVQRKNSLTKLCQSRRSVGKCANLP